jgi:hypothetical protein
VRGDGFVGTQGVGFIAVSPALPNDVPTCFYTDITYARNDIAILAADSVFNTGVNTGLHNGPYTTGNFVQLISRSAPANGRIVSVGLKVNYTGTTLSQSGLVYGYRSAEHENCTEQPSASGNPAVPITLAGLGQRPDTIICPTEREGCTISDYASCSQELEYANQGDHANPTDSTMLIYPYCKNGTGLTEDFTYTITSQLQIGHPTMMFAISGVPGTSFHFELILHIEYIGLSAVGKLTGTHTDLLNAHRILNAANSVNRERSRNGGSAWSTFVKALKAGAKALKPHVVPAIEAGLMALAL